jgi:hypothetical protein
MLPPGCSGRRTKRCADVLHHEVALASYFHFVIGPVNHLAATLCRNVDQPGRRMEGHGSLTTRQSNLRKVGSHDRRALDPRHTLAANQRTEMVRQAIAEAVRE